ncbi:TRI25 ligase, partial [Atractosteus spatula]|nr:TRI25 ligase [Atractosteus spatula]
KMAEGKISVSEDEFICSVCLDLLKDPVTLHCGHNYCMDCIKTYWDRNEDTRVYKCPQCRQTFTPRPDLRRNTTLGAVVEKLKRRGDKRPYPADNPAGPGDVPCDVCTERQMRAVKSCLVCLASYCHTHLDLHNELNPGNRHKLVATIGPLQERICSSHEKPLEIYCRTDQKCICYLCKMYEHRGHDTVSAAEERTEKQKQLGVTQTQTQQRLQNKKKKKKELRQAVNSLRSSAKTNIKDPVRILHPLICFIERKCSDIRQLIRAQERGAVNQAEGLLVQLEQEITELKRRNDELNQLSHTEDHIHFLQNLQSLCVFPGAEDSPHVTANPYFSPEIVKEALSGLKEQLEDICKGGFDKISRTGATVPVHENCLVTMEANVYLSRPLQPEGAPSLSCLLFPVLCCPSGVSLSLGLYISGSFICLRSALTFGCPETCLAPGRPMSATCGHSVREQCKGYQSAHTGNERGHDYRPPNRQHFHMRIRPCRSILPSDTQCDFCHLTLDLNTAHRDLCLSEGNRKVCWSEEEQNYPDSPERFDSWRQLLCREGLSGMCFYWEVQWSGIGVYISVTYKGISRKGEGDDDCRLGHNDKSWSLFCSGSSCCFLHSKENTTVTVPPSSRIGVYLDHVAGNLSFYNVSGDTVTLLHRVQTSFSEPLYPGFGVGYGLIFISSSVTLCQLE